MHDHRIEIDLGNIVGMVGGKPRQRDHQVGERLDVRRRRAAVAAEHLRASEAAEQGARGGLIERHRRQRHIAERLDQHAAEPGHQHQAPCRVAIDAENDFAAGRRHRLHQHAVDARRRRMTLGGCEHAIIGRAHRIGAGEIQGDGAGFGLVRNIVGLDLERHRPPDRLRGGSSRVARMRELSHVVGADAVCRKERPRTVFT